MPLSLNFIVATLVASIAIVVAATCVAISLITSLDQIDQVGSAWALGMAKGVAATLKTFIDSRERELLGGSFIAQTQADKLASDLADIGQNWTETWLDYLTISAMKLEYNFVSRTLLFNDLYWMYAADSWRDRSAFTIEWIEPHDNPGFDSTVGTRRWWKSNSTLFPLDAGDGASGYTAEAIVNGVYLYPMSTPDFGVLRNALKTKVQYSADPTKSQLIWLSPSFGYYPEKNTYWEQFCAAAIVNSTGYILGYNFVSLAMDREIASFLSEAPRSKNGQIMIVDKDKYVLSTTYSAPFFTMTNVTPSTVAPNGCGTTFSQPLLVPTRMGCRALYSDYAYPPLQALSADFVVTDGTAETTVNVGGDDYLAISHRFASNSDSLRFNLVVFVPRDDLLGGVAAGTNMAIGIAVGIVVGAIIVAVIITYFTLRPLSDIAEKMEKTARLEGLDKDEVLEDNGDDSSSSGGANNRSGNNSTAGGSDVSGNISLASASIIKEIANLEIAYAFSHNQLVNFTRYVPKSVVKEVLIKRGQDMSKMVNAQVTVSTADIKSFTSLVESTDSAMLSKLLHSYFKRMTKLVMAHGGIIDRFIGDCIMAVWSSPFKVARHELLGALCGLAYQYEVNRNPLKQLFIDANFPLAVRVGVASGHVLAGNIGSSKRQAYTVMGMAAVTADALESYNKQWSTHLMVSEEVARECSDELVLRLLTRVKLTGRANPVMVYHCMGVQPDAKLKKRRPGASGGAMGDTASGGGSGSESSSDLAGLGSGSPFGGSSDVASFNESGSSMSDMLTATSHNSEESGDLLPENVNLDKLLFWHKKRTACDDNTVSFAHEFNEAARCVIDHDFSGALKKIQAMETDNWIPEKWKTHKSVSILKDLIKKAMTGNDGSVSASKQGLGTSTGNDFFVKVD